MGARLTDRQKKQIVADYLECQSINLAAKRNGVSWGSAQKAILGDGDFEKKLEDKKDQNTADILKHMEGQKEKVCQIIDLYLNELLNVGQFKNLTPSQLTTALGTLIDKWAPKGQPLSNEAVQDDDPITAAIKEEFANGAEPKAKGYS